ncbi:GntR family transcriptional regulator [uncultured Tateyamaria sp.]|uniref:GntR family transcriptional regulator n=1 Tax=Tateyamaria sp. 1078 TaxID=3417464 RepID=UPI00262CD7A6|nr:GntR family transcriptional regulator [uncultured Tateyamaria sp.]
MTQGTASHAAQPATGDSIAQALSLAIHEHRIAPGTKLGEGELADIYGVSRTVVRAALLSLSHIKLVDIRRNKGASVASPSPTEAHEVFEARELLEPRTAHTAARRATQADIARLERHISDEHAALDAADPGRALYLSGLFHTEIARIADQATIAGFIETLVARSSLIIALYWRRESALCEKHAHHALVQALADGNATQAEELMRSHLVDLHSALDLRERNGRTLSLRDALSP